MLWMGLVLLGQLATAPRSELPVPGILAAFESAQVVALGENHGHEEFHALLLRMLRDPGFIDTVDDVAVEWGNHLYQPVMDRFMSGENVPEDSLEMAWRNTVVSPNTVWDSPVYEAFFRGVRQINQGLPPEDRYRVLLADSPVDWSAVQSRADLAPFYDRARAMADVIRRESVRQGRKVLFVAGGLHVERKPRVRRNSRGVPIGEITPVAWLELYHPGSTFIIQSVAREDQVVRPELRSDDGPRILRMDRHPELSTIPAVEMTTLKNADGSRAQVFGGATLGTLVDAVLIWNVAQVTMLDPDPATYQDDRYWQELNRRSMLVRGQPMDPSLRPSGS